MAFESLIYEGRDDVALITLNRPDRLNAWTWTMAREIGAAIEGANADPLIGAIVVTGAGRAFCAGADIKENLKARIDAHDQGDDRPLVANVDLPALFRRSKPLIAAVNGAAIGVGCTFILPFDVIVASEQAKFGAVFVRMGVVPEMTSSHFLVQRMGFGRASEMLLSGRIYDAGEAYEKGLADRLTPHELLMPNAFELAHMIAANPARQLAMTKHLITENGCATDLDAVRRRELELFQACTRLPEHREAVRAFIEKRPARFK